jgi:hypothetical protein
MSQLIDDHFYQAISWENQQSLSLTLFLSFSLSPMG